MSTKIEVTQFKKPHKDLYNDFNHGPFSSPQWIESFRNRFLHPVYFLFTEKEKPIGVISGLKVLSSNPIKRGLGLSSYLFFFTGPVVTSQEYLPNCIKSLNEKACTMYENVFYASWDYPCTNSQLYPVQHPQRLEYIIDLPHEPGEIEKKVKPKQLKNIEKAIENGLELIEDTCITKLILLNKIMDETTCIRQKKGYPEYKKYYIPHLSEHVMENLLNNNILRLFHVELDEQTLNSTAIVTYGKRAYALLAGTTQKGYKNYASPFSFYEICHRLRDEKKIYLNLGSVPDDNSKSNLRRFKLSLGALEHSCPRGSLYFPPEHMNIFNNDVLIRAHQMS